MSVATTTPARFGTNLKLTIDRARRDRVRVLFTETLGAAYASPRADLDLFKLADGFSIGVFYVDAADALTEAQYAQSAWLEFAVPDPDAAARALRAREIEPVAYATDTTHVYFRVPGGPVFRLAAVAR